MWDLSSPSQALNLHPSELEGQVLTYWTTREVPALIVLNHSYIITEASDSQLYIPYGT